MLHVNCDFLKWFVPIKLDLCVGSIICNWWFDSINRERWSLRLYIEAISKYSKYRLKYSYDVFGKANAHGWILFKIMLFSLHLIVILIDILHFHLSLRFSTTSEKKLLLDA